MENEFARMMLSQGVRPIGMAPAAEPEDTHEEENYVQAPPVRPVEENSGISWLGGDKAREALQSAIMMIAEDRQKGKNVWINGIRQDGRQLTIRPQATMGEIVGQADRENLRLIVLGGDEWTCVMHPALGIATIEKDAK